MKYYDLEDYHRRKKEKKIAKKKLLDKEYRFDDEEDKRKEKERKRTEDHNRRIQEAYYELKTSEKASDMKQQVFESRFEFLSSIFRNCYEPN